MTVWLSFMRTSKNHCQRLASMGCWAIYWISGITSLNIRNCTFSPWKHHTFKCRQVSSTPVKVTSGAWCLFAWSFCSPSQSLIPKWERLFLLMNRVKTDTRATLSESSLINLITIWAEGPEPQHYDPTPAIESWLLSAHCQTNLKIQKYKRQKCQRL